MAASTVGAEATVRVRFGPYSQVAAVIVASFAVGLLAVMSATCLKSLTSSRSHSVVRGCPLTPTGATGAGGAGGAGAGSDPQAESVPARARASAMAASRAVRGIVQPLVESTAIKAGL